MTSVLPGSKLGIADKFTGKEGTFVRNNLLLASVWGTSTVEGNEFSVESKTTLKPKVGDVVVARVTKISRKQVNVAIIALMDRLLGGEFNGTIGEKDVSLESAEIHHCFRPGDVILAKIMSSNDGFRLSTAGKEFGVIMARSAAGHLMIPISWSEMQCPVTEQVEKRKCAKPDLDEMQLN